MRSSVSTALLVAVVGRNYSVGAAAPPLEAAEQVGAGRSLFTLQASRTAGLELQVRIHREHFTHLLGCLVRQRSQCAGQTLARIGSDTYF
jgi:hypothetical protein